MQFCNSHKMISWARKRHILVFLRLFMWLHRSPVTSTVKVSLLTPTRLKATHSTVILRLDSPTVRTLSTSTAPYSSRCTSTVGAWRGMAICSPVVSPLHLPRSNTYTVRQNCGLLLNHCVDWMASFKDLCWASDPRALLLTWALFRNTGTRWSWGQDIQTRCKWVLWHSPISPRRWVSLPVSEENRGE